MTNESEPPRQLSSRNSDVSSVTTDGDQSQIGQGKKLPPSKVAVGLAPSPDIRNCKSKINSLDNIKHAPKGGNVSLPKNPIVWKASSKVGSLNNIKHKPGGGAVKIFNETYAKKVSPKQHQQEGDNNDSSSSTTNH